MITYPLTSPPNKPGIYALKSSVTGQVYIGKAVNLARRYSEWKGVFVTGLGAKSKSIRDVVIAGGLEHWSFSVVVELPSATPTKLAELERRAIARAVGANPGKVLNVILPGVIRHGREAAEGNVPKSVVRDEGGAVLTYGQVAARLGVTKQAVKKRLQRQRLSGVTEISMGALVGVP